MGTNLQQELTQIHQEAWSSFFRGEKGNPTTTPRPLIPNENKLWGYHINQWGDYFLLLVFPNINSLPISHTGGKSYNLNDLTRKYNFSHIGLT